MNKYWRMLILRKLTIIAISIIFLSGCWDSQNLEDQSFVIGIGVDKGQDNMIKITYIMPNPEYGTQAQGGSSSTSNKEVITMEGNDLISIKDRMNTVVAKKISYNQLQFIAVSEELASDNDFIRMMYDTTKDVEIRRDVKLLVTKQSAQEFLEKTHPKLEARVHKYYNLMIKGAGDTGLIPLQSQLLEYLRVTESKSDLFLAIYSGLPEETSNDNEKNNVIAGDTSFEGHTNAIQFAGSALFREGKMIGKINGEETRIAQLLNNTIPSVSALDSFPDPFDKNGQITVKVTKSKKNDIKMNLKEEKPIINVTVSMDLEVLTDHALTDYSKKANRDHLKKELDKTIQKEIIDFINKTQTEFKAAPFAWSLFARKEFKTLKAYEDFQFAEKYPDMEIQLKVKTKVENYGRQKNIPDVLRKQKH